MHTATSFCLYRLATVLAQLGIDNKLFVSSGTLIVNQRHELIRAAQEWSATHVMFIDSDMEFTPECVLSLLDRNKQVVAAAYSKRAEPFVATAWHEIGNWNSYVTDFSNDIIQCDAIATGFMLIDVSVFDTLPMPWFKLGWYNNQYVGEDIEFCRMLLEHKIPLYLDLTVSKKLGHLGTKSYKIEDLDA
jgi:choline kinase